MKQKRIRYFDIARGIAILCVIAGHNALLAQQVATARTAEWVISFCFSFHMPLFFILSGFFMHPERPFQWKKEAQQLICTYLVTAILVLIGIAVAAVALHVDVGDALIDWGNAALFGAGDFHPHTLWPVNGRIGAIWFLLALFWAHLLLHLIYRLPYHIIWVILYFIVGYWSGHYIWLPWSIQSGMCAVSFLYLGVQAKRYKVLDLMDKYPLLWILAAAVWATSIVWFGGFSMAVNQYGTRPVLAVIGSIAGTVCVVGISRLLDHVKGIGTVLAFAGRNSLGLLCAHLIEDDVLPWLLIMNHIRNAVTWMPLWFVGLTICVILDSAIAVLLYRIPVINTWFYPRLLKQEHSSPKAHLDQDSREDLPYAPSTNMLQDSVSSK